MRAASHAERISLLSLPNELLLEMLREPGSLYLQRRKEKLEDDWYSSWTNPCTRYTRPWSTEHHPIALPLSQTCRRLREHMLPSVWEEVGLDSLEDLCKLRSGLRLFPEHAELIVRLEWRWLWNNPAQMDAAYRREHPEIIGGRFKSLHVWLQPPFRWPKQPMETEEECVEAMTEVICQLRNLDTLLWTSPHLHLRPQVVEFLASKAVPLKGFQMDVGGVAGYEFRPDVVPYWRFARKLEKLSLHFIPIRDEENWSRREMARWRDYDDALSGLEAFCEQWLEEEEQQDGEAEEASETEAAGETQPDLAQEERSKRLAKLIFSERQAVATYRTLIAACEGNLRVLTIDPEWVLSLPALVPYWVKLERCFLPRASEPPADHLAVIKEIAHWGRKSYDDDYVADLLFTRYAEWTLGAAAIRPAIYHAARHRNEPGSLTAEDVQEIGKQGARYPASLFYPSFRSRSVAQRLVEQWERLVAQGEGERVRCQCEECR